ncbi:MAG: hypothetical protein ACI8PB_004318 [Desulforhopalus sp.]|jgi:hypothetical protein
MRYTRRRLLKNMLLTGIVLGGSTLGVGCTSVKRKDLQGATQEIGSAVLTLDDKTNAILYHASLAPSTHNCQPWRVCLKSQNQWIIEADPGRKLPKVDPENRELILSLGTFVENLSIASGTLGMWADINIIARTRNDKEVLSVQLHEDTKVDYPLQRLNKRRTVRNGQLSRNIFLDDLKALSKAADGYLQYFPSESQHASCLREAAVEAFRMQSQRDEAQKEFVSWLRLDNRAARQLRDGITTESMEISDFKGWVVRTFFTPDDFLKPNFRQQGIDATAEQVQQGGGWLILTSPGKGIPDLIESGRRFERLALTAHECGIGLHPMTQILEEKSGQSLIFANHEKNVNPQFILRAGYLKKMPVATSLRRPVERFVYA